VLANEEESIHGHRLENLAERQLCSFPTGRNRHRAVLKELLIEGVRILCSDADKIDRSRHKAVSSVDPIIA